MQAEQQQMQRNGSQHEPTKAKSWVRPDHIEGEGSRNEDQIMRGFLDMVSQLQDCTKLHCYPSTLIQHLYWIFIRLAKY